MYEHIIAIDSPVGGHHAPRHGWRAAATVGRAATRSTAEPGADRTGARLRQDQGRPHHSHRPHEGATAAGTQMGRYTCLFNT